MGKQKLLEERDSSDDRTVNLNAIGFPGKPPIEFSRTPLPLPEDVPDKSLFATIFRRDTSIGSALNRVDRGSFKASVDDPHDFLTFVPERYQQRFDSYALVTNQAEADTITRALDQEIEDTIRVSQSPVKSFFYNFAVQPLDPVNYLPGGVIWKNYKKLSTVAKGALAAGTAGLVSTAAQESIIQSNQLSRELEESVTNTLAAGVLSGTIGGLAGAFGPKTGRFNQKVKQRATKEISNVITENPKPLTDDGTLTPNDLANMPSFAQKGMVTSLMNRMFKSEFDTPKQSADELYAHDYTTIKNQGGVANRNAEQLIGLDINEANKVLVDYQSIFFKQAGVERGFLKARRANKAALLDPTGQILNFETFDREVSKVIFSGEEHSAASVNDAAKLLQEKIFNPMRDRAIELGELPNGVSPKNATNYFTQRWDIKKVTADQAGFSKMTEDWFTRINEVSKQIRKDNEYQKIQKQVTKLKKELALAKKTKDAPKTKELTQKIKEREKSLNKTAKDLGGTVLKEDEVEGLFHTKGARKGELRGVLTEAEIKASVAQTTDRILGNDTSKITHQIVDRLDGKSKPLKDRSFLIPQRIGFEYMNQSASDVAGKYINAMAPGIRMAEQARALGFESIKEWHDGRIESLAKEFKEKNKGLEGVEAIKLDKRFKTQRQNITDSFKLLLGVYGDGPNIYDGSYAKFYKAFLNWNYIRLLGFMTLSSIPDVGLHVFTHGPYATIHNGLRPVLKQAFGTLKNFSKDDLNAIGVSLNTVLGSRIKAMAGHEGPGESATFFGKTLDNMVQTFGNVTLMNQWNDMQQMIAGTMSINRSLKTIESIALGKKTLKVDRERLAKLGIAENEISTIHDMWVKAGRAEDSGTYFADWVNWDVTTQAQAKAFESFKAATLKEIDQVVIIPKLGDKPLIAQTGLGKLLLQFKSFAFAATNKILFSGIQRRHDANIYFGMSIMLGLGALSYVTTQVFRGNEDIDLSFGKLSQEAFDRSGLLGITTEVYNLAAKAGLGFGAPTSRFQSRGIWGTILGPSTGLVEDFLTSVNKIRKADGENPLTVKDLEQMFRLAPYQNLFYTYYLSRRAMNNVGPELGFAPNENQKDQLKDLFK